MGGYAVCGVVMGKPRSASKVALSEVSVRGPWRSGTGGVGPSDAEPVNDFETLLITIY